MPRKAATTKKATDDKLADLGATLRMKEMIAEGAKITESAKGRSKHEAARGKKKADPKKEKRKESEVVVDGEFHHHKTPHEYDRPDPKGVVTIDLVTGEKFDIHPAQLVLDNDLERYRYSHSFCKTYSTCQFKGVCYRIKAPSVPVFALERGIVAHSVVEEVEKDPTTDVMKLLDDLWKTRILDKYQDFSDKDKSSINSEGYEETVYMVEDWVHENLDLVTSGRIKPEDVEVEFNLPVTFKTEHGTFQRIFNGKIDLVLWNGDRTKYHLFDFKTSYNAPSDDELALEPQFTLYQWAATQLFGKPPVKMFWYHLRGKHKTPEEHDPPLRNKQTGELLKKSPAFSEPGPKGGGHPRVPECLKYAFEMPLRSQREIDNYFNNFVAGVIINYESGNMAKTGLSDPDECVRCQYKAYCDKTDIRLPFHVRVVND